MSLERQIPSVLKNIGLEKKCFDCLIRVLFRATLNVFITVWDFFLSAHEKYTLFRYDRVRLDEKWDVSEH